MWGIQILSVLIIFHTCVANVIEVTNDNIEAVMRANVAFLNFYADWCHFSRQLEPIFREASESFPATDLEKENNVLFARVDCMLNDKICKNNRVSKYPTMKLFRRGALAKQEYRGARSKDAIATFINSQLTDAFKVYETPQQLASINKDKINVIAYDREATESDGMANFKVVAFQLRDECDFHVAQGPNFPESSSGTKISFRDKGDEKDTVSYTGDLKDLKLMYFWVREKCMPLIRELTFENAEAMTEAGLPFLILFKDKNDKQSLEVFAQAVEREIPDEREKLVILYAEGSKFSHPLMHLGKTVNDLPLIAIDSFQHMYLFPKFDQLNVKGKLKKFVEDLYSDKLHRQFHHGPDPNEKEEDEETAQNNVEYPSEISNNKREKDTEPPPTKKPSIFVKLKPSEDRYTLLDKTEL